MKRILKALYNIVRYTIIGWYHLFEHIIDGLERYENTCKKREKVRKSEEKHAKEQITRVPWR